MSEPIRNGYYLKARCIENSDIAHAPPHAREVFDYFLRKAFWKDGDPLKRGQLLTSYKKIQEALRWYVGNRPVRYKKHEIETAVKLLARTGAITTARTTRGMIITVCNYERYQSPENYENHSETDAKQKRGRRESPTIDEEGKAHKNKKKERKESCASGDARRADFSNDSYCGLTGERLKSFNEFWAAFDYKKGKSGAAKAWQRLGNMSDDLFQQIIAGAKREAGARQKRLDQGLIPKMAQGWLMDQRWEDELSEHESDGCKDDSKSQAVVGLPKRLKLDF